jgi:hypothetical protein
VSWVFFWQTIIPAIDPVTSDAVRAVLSLFPDTLAFATGKYMCLAPGAGVRGSLFCLLLFIFATKGVV